MHDGKQEPRRSQEAESEDVNMLAFALGYARKGYPVFPWHVVGDKKVPLIKDWPNAATTDEKKIREWWTKWPEAGIGVPTGDSLGRFALDIDPRHGGDKSLAVLEEQHGPLPDTLEVFTGGGGWHRWFNSRGLNITSMVLAPGLEIKGNGGYAVLPPSVHPNGKRYQWANNARIVDPPEYLVNLILNHKKAKAASRPEKKRVAYGERHEFFKRQAGRYRRNGDDPATIFEKLKIDYRDRCEHEPPVEDAELRDMAGYMERFTPAEESPPPGPPEAVIPPETRIIGYGREDTSNGIRLVRDHGRVLRYWHERKKWLLWDGARWSEDALGRVRELAKQTAQTILAEAGDVPEEEAAKQAKWGVRSLCAAKISDMLKSAETIPALATTTSHWDQHLYLLNFQNGTVDLRTGQLRPHRQDDYLTKVVDCDFQTGLVPPRWCAFVQQVFGASLVPWIQKAVGYSVTGVTSEKCAFFLWGPTDTGKTTFLTVLRELFREYSATVQVENLMLLKKFEHDANALADLSDLRGARLVVTSETQEGQRLDEAKLKRFTQGMGTIKAARKYENPVTFPETHKAWLDCNHAPVIRGTDDSIWNRVLSIPAKNRVADKDKDPKLKSKLLAEAPGIAAWAVAGAVRWAKEGLGRPAAITETREGWRSQFDLVGQFLEERTTPGESVRATPLYQAFKKWAEDQGHGHAMNATAFGLRVADHGIEKRHDMNGTAYVGITLNDELFPT
jgi:putative DNA primase/helicase